MCDGSPPGTPETSSDSSRSSRTGAGLTATTIPALMAGKPDLDLADRVTLFCGFPEPRRRVTLVRRDALSRAVGEREIQLAGDVALLGGETKEPRGLRRIRRDAAAALLRSMAACFERRQPSPSP